MTEENPTKYINQYDSNYTTNHIGLYIEKANITRNNSVILKFILKFNKFREYSQNPIVLEFSYFKNNFRENILISCFQESQRSCLIILVIICFRVIF